MNTNKIIINIRLKCYIRGLWSLTVGSAALLGNMWNHCCTLEKLQNRSIRIVTDCPNDAPDKPLQRQLRLPSIAEMIRQEPASMVYKAINGQAPPYLS